MQSSKPPPVVLTPFTPEERVAFTSAVVADFADFLLAQGKARDQAEALQRARAEIEEDIEFGTQAGDEFWVAQNCQGMSIGWLWVKLSEQEQPPASAFLYEILVKREMRRQGYATAMLGALEKALAAVGRSELRLNVWDNNEPARGLYERAGYELAECFSGKRQLRKRLPPSGPTWADGGREGIPQPLAGADTAQAIQFLEIAA